MLKYFIMKLIDDEVFMPIRPVYSAKNYNPEDLPRPDGLRNPQLSDLPKTVGPSTTNPKVSTVFAQFLGIKAEGDELMKKIKKVESTLLSSDEEYKKSVGELADAFIDGLKGQPVSDLEPFEVYATKVRQDFYLKSNDFKERFINGYEVLKEQSTKDESAKMDQKNPPPGSITI
jgi:hypothetical protein